MKIHELAGLFPMMNDGEFKGLEEDIKRNGLIEPIMLFEGKILDGRNRYKACKKLGVDLKTKEFDGKDALQYIISTNLHRRHLNESQRGIVANRLSNLSHGGDRSKSSNDPLRRKNVSKLLNVSVATIKRAKKIEREKPESIKEIESGKKTIGAVEKEIKEEKREQERKNDKKKAEQLKSPEELFKKIKFSTIVIDPPWDWNDEGDINQLGRARPDYATLSFEELKKLPIPYLSKKDSHIYLWITNRSLPKGFELLKKWGYRYITCLTWCKPSIGMGNYFRGSSEQILFGVKGSLSLKVKNVGTWFTAKRGDKKHSSKPDEFYEIVEKCSHGLYLDYFGRKKRKGWYLYGS